MRKIFLAAILSAGCLSPAFAQTDNAINPKEKLYTHVFGVQLNDLMRQIFTFNNSTAAANTNPFLFTYNINRVKSGWGLRAGLGMTINSSTTNDNVTKRTSDINDMQFRLGVEKAFSLSNKWSTGVGIDGVIKTNDDKTTAVTNSGYIYTTNTVSKFTTLGAGGMAWLRYHLTDRILLGTETSFYYLRGTNKQTITTSNNGPFGNVDETKTDDDVTEGKISVPVVFYISVKF